MRLLAREWGGESWLGEHLLMVASKKFNMILFTYLEELSALLRNNCLYLNIIEVKKKNAPPGSGNSSAFFHYSFAFLSNYYFLTHGYCWGIRPQVSHDAFCVVLVDGFRAPPPPTASILLHSHHWGQGENPGKQNCPGTASLGCRWHRQQD